MKINEVVRKQVLVIYRGIGKGRLFRGGKFRWRGFDLLEKQEITRKRKKTTTLKYHNFYMSILFMYRELFWQWNLSNDWKNWSGYLPIMQSTFLRNYAINDSFLYFDDSSSNKICFQWYCDLCHCKSNLQICNKIEDKMVDNEENENFSLLSTSLGVNWNDKRGEGEDQNFFGYIF